MPEVYSISYQYNHTVGIEAVGGQMMLIDHLQKKQVATMSGQVEDWARTNYPSEDYLKQPGVVQNAIAGMATLMQVSNANDTLDEWSGRWEKPGSPPPSSNDKRGVCGACPILIFTCGVNGASCEFATCIVVLCVQ